MPKQALGRIDSDTFAQAIGRKADGIMKRMTVSARSILGVAEHIARNFPARKIILFGSYAYGTPDEDSDVDFLIVMRHERPPQIVATEIRLSMDPIFPMDLLVRSPAEIRAAMRQKDWFMVEVMEKGIVLHDQSNRAVGAKGRSRLRRRLASEAVA